MRKKIFFEFIFVFCLLSLVASLQSLSYAEDKNWNAAGDQSNWLDDANWMPAGAPTAADDVRVDLQDASVTIPEAFNAKSITLGGKKQSSLSVSNFVTGKVEPASSSDIAVTNRRDGTLILKGSAGQVTLKGGYKDSEQVIADEPSFMFYVQ